MSTGGFLVIYSTRHSTQCRAHLILGSYDDFRTPVFAHAHRESNESNTNYLDPSAIDEILVTVRGISKLYYI